MPVTYQNNGIRFQYPENWQLEEESGESGWTLTLQSPNTTFLLISERGDEPPEQVLVTVRDVLKGDYPGLEADDTIGSIAGRPAAGVDMQFISLDLPITCGVRSFLSETGTLLVMWQAADLDWENSEAVVKAICSSMQVEDV